MGNSVACLLLGMEHGTAGRGRGSCSPSALAVPVPLASLTPANVNFSLQGESLCGLK